MPPELTPLLAFLQVAKSLATQHPIVAWFILATWVGGHIRMAAFDHKVFGKPLFLYVFLFSFLSPQDADGTWRLPMQRLRKRLREAAPKLGRTKVRIGAAPLAGGIVVAPDGSAGAVVPPTPAREPSVIVEDAKPSPSAGDTAKLRAMTSSDGFVLPGVLRALAFSFALAVGMLGCATTTAVRPALQAAVVGAGSAVNQLSALHLSAYSATTARMREEIPTREAYLTAMVPVDAEYDARGEVIQALTTQLFAAAAVIDASRAGPLEMNVMQLGRRTLAALIAAVAVLGRGHYLPAVQIPQQLQTIITTLQSITGATGTEGEATP